MNRLMLALHGYESLAGSIQSSLNEQVSDRAEEWLRNEVCPLAEELSLDPAFHRVARWSLEHFAPGSEHKDRGLVEDVDRALVRFAQIVGRTMAGDPTDAASDCQSSTETVSFELTAVSLVASRPWFDLVAGDDFLHPSHELFLRNPNRQHTERFRKGPERRLPLGDYVTRMMLARVEYWKTLLDRVFNQVFVAPRNEMTFQTREEVFVAKIELDQAVERLVQAARQRDSKLREAATTLVQVYAAYAPNPTLDWMRLPSSFLQAHRGSIHSCIRRRGTLITTERQGGQLRELHREDALLCDPAVLRQIAAAIQDLAPLYEVPSDNLDRLKWALDRARLVMVDSRPRAVYWDEKPVAEDAWCSHEREWDLLWNLVRRANCIVNQAMLMNPDGHAIRSRRHRLGKLLHEAPTLDEFIESRRGGGYCLTLEPDMVMLLRNENGQLAIV